ncbi:META domain-containing protein [Trinickia sp.]|uniref:META domain-containing protein n=1 Tax=Trinickia sp. TaxID=2571163 RepID=UPI003F80B9D2
MSNPLTAPPRGTPRARLALRAGVLAAALTVAACAMPTHPDSEAGPSNPLNPAAVQLLDNTSWVLRTVQTSDGHSVLDVPADKAAAPTLTLDTRSGERRASGFAGCNRFGGAYTLTSGKLGFGPLAATRMACGENADRIERVYLDALAHADATLVQMQAPQQMRIIATTGVTLTFARADR